jgi:hypothetical protein
MILDRSRQRSHSDDVSLDLDDLGDSPRRSLADNDPRSLADDRRITCLGEKGPWHPGLVFAVQIDHEVNLGL